MKTAASETRTWEKTWQHLRRSDPIAVRRENAPQLDAPALGRANPPANPPGPGAGWAGCLRLTFGVHRLVLDAEACGSQRLGGRFQSPDHRQMQHGILSLGNGRPRCLQGPSVRQSLQGWGGLRPRAYALPAWTSSGRVVGGDCASGCVRGGVGTSFPGVRGVRWGHWFRVCVVCVRWAESWVPGVCGLGGEFGSGCAWGVGTSFPGVRDVRGLGREFGSGCAWGLGGEFGSVCAWGWAESLVPGRCRSRRSRFRGGRGVCGPLKPLGTASSSRDRLSAACGPGATR